MPFTGSHPAAVLPLSRSSLPLSALVIGSMVPDLPFYVPTPYGRRLSHRFLGVVTVDVAAGLLVHEAWLRVVGPAVRAYAPPAISGRVTLARADAARVVAGVGLGALTHVVWDAFTHEGGWGVRLVPALRTTAGPLAAYEWAQYLGGAGGAVAIGWWAWRRRAPAPPARWRRGRVVTAVVAVAAVAGGALGFRHGLGRPDPVRSAFYHGATWAVDAGVIALAGAWFLRRRA
ncbi:DUF4184 family protein [Actinoplanes sp. NPDC049265]|uniref:DUF4184 family protein n=1 Tax=Actinoplanes sp. NPDC049265 TaxID=3363902 RepID=UPI003712DDE2